MSRGIRVGKTAGYPVIRTENLVMHSVTVTPTNTDQVLYPDTNTAYDQVLVNPVTSDVDTNIIPENIKEGITILGITGTYKGEHYLTKSIDNHSLANAPYFINTKDIKDLDDFVLAYAYSNTRLFGNLYFYDLEKISGEYALYHTFDGCLSFVDIYFPALKSNAFGSITNQLTDMLLNTNTHTLHFPSNLETVIATLDGYPMFGGTNITCVFDLAATE